MIKHIPTMNDTIKQWQETPDYRQIKREKLAVWSMIGLLSFIITWAILGMFNLL